MANHQACSICLEPVTDDSNRSKVELRCRHLFHLDCIGSAFNAKGAMECPNCKRTEVGKWTLFPEGIDADHMWDSDEDIDDDIPPPEPIPNVFQGHHHQASGYSNLPAVEISGGVQNGSGLHNAFQIISASITNIVLPRPHFFANFPCPHLMSMQAPIFTQVTNSIDAPRQGDGMLVQPLPVEPVMLQPVVHDSSFGSSSRGYYDQDQVRRNQFSCHEPHSYNNNYSPLQILVDSDEHGRHYHHSHGVVNYSSVNDTPLPSEDDPSLELTL